ncbi:MAG: DNA repair protein RecO [Pyrinomonadaceae bacterium]
MPLIDTEALVLRSYKLAESHKIVVFLTRQVGLIRGVAHGAQRLKSKFGAALEPYTVISLNYFEKEGRELVTVKNADIIQSHFDLAKSFEIISALEYMSKLILSFVQPHEPSPLNFRMFKATIDALTMAPEKLSQIMLYFKVWLLRIAGFWPNFEKCGTCRRSFENTEDAYLIDDSLVVCVNCAKPNRINALRAGAGLRAIIHLIERLPPIDFARQSESFSKPNIQNLHKTADRMIDRALESSTHQTYDYSKLTYRV